MLPHDDDVLKFKEHFRVECFDAEVYLVSEVEKRILPGRGMRVLAGLLDGKRSVAEVMQQAPFHPAETLFQLGELLERGLIEKSPRSDSPIQLPAHIRAFWSSLGVDAAALARVAIEVVVVDDVLPRAEVEKAFAGVGFALRRTAETTHTIAVVVVDDYLSVGLEPVVARLEAPWFLVKPFGRKTFSGPYFDKDDGPCWHCLAFWLSNNRPVETLLRRERAASFQPPPRLGLDATIETALRSAALQLARMIVLSERAATLSVTDAFTLAPASYEVVRRPQCGRCGDPEIVRRVGEAPIRPQPIAKKHVEDGGYRRQDPVTTFERFRHLVGPVIGAVTHVHPFPGRSSPTRPVFASGYMSCPAVGRPSENVFDKGCAGKGRSPEQARTSALCEALERFSGVHRGDEARRRATMDELGAAAISPSALLLFSERQIRDRKPSALASVDARHFVPDALPLNEAIDWSPAWSLTHDERRWIPLPYCYAEAPPETGGRYTRACGNGVAAGTCLEEALLQGVLELVERDAAAMWWYQRVRRPGIDLVSFRDPFFQSLVDEYRESGWEVWALDLTHDLGIPTFVALAHMRAEDRFGIGFGCHVDGKLALQRALTELNQTFDRTAVKKAPWGATPAECREFLFPLDGEMLDATSERFQPSQTTDLTADLLRCKVRLEHAGLELIAVDKTRPDIGLSVVQAIVPGLRHFWPRFAPGRLYAVPAALGWACTTNEDSLNPIALFV